MTFDSKTDSVEQDQLYAGNYPVVEIGATLITGQNLTRGTVLGVITASGKYAIVNDALSDGTEVAKAILLESTDATSEDKVIPIALSGDFNIAALTYGGDDVAADHDDALRALNIYTYKTAISVQQA